MRAKRRGDYSSPRVFAFKLSPSQILSFFFFENIFRFFVLERFFLLTLDRSTNSTAQLFHPLSFFFIHGDDKSWKIKIKRYSLETLYGQCDNEKVYSTMSDVIWIYSTGLEKNSLKLCRHYF